MTKSTIAARIPFSKLPPLGPPNKDATTPPELDIHWHRWHDSAPAFLGRDAAEKVAKSTGVPMPARLFEPRAIGHDWVRRGETRDAGLTVLALLNSVHEATSEQLAFWTGDPRLRDPRSQILRTLWSERLIEEATSSHFRRAPGLRLWRLAANDVFERVVAPLLTFAELVSVTGDGGEYLSTARRFARHDGHMAEFLRRVGAWVPEIAVCFGEAFGSHGNLAIAQAEKLDRQATVDGVLIRAVDGLQIAVELQASSGSPRFVAKLVALCWLLISNPQLAVLVVSVAKRTGSAPADAGLASSVRSSIVQARKKFVEEVGWTPTIAAALDSVWARMLIANWSTEYFPEPGADGPVTTPAFLNLEAERMAGDGWQRVSLLDPIAVPVPLGWDEDPRAIAPMANGALLRQTAPVQRARLRASPRLALPELWRVPVSALGLPTLSTSGSSRGAVGASRPPARLLNLDD